MRTTTTSTVILGFIFALLASSCTAQFDDPTITQINTTKIYTDAYGTIISLAPREGNSACSADFFILRDDPNNCFARLHPDLDVDGDVISDNYTVTELGCPSEFVGATVIKCLPLYYRLSFTVTYCFVLNPTTNNLFMLDLEGNILYTYDLAAIGILNAKTFDPLWEWLWGVDNNPTQWIDLLLLDGNNKLWTYVIFPEVPEIITDDTHPVAVTELQTVTGNVVGFAAFPMGVDPVFALAFAGDTTVHIFDFFSGSEIVTFGTFGNIVAMTVDSVGNIHVLDGSTNSVIVISDSAVTLRNATLPAGHPALKDMTSSRNKGLLVDSAGISKYEEDLSYTFSDVVTSTCANRLGSASLSFRGGDYPLLALVRPGRPKDAATNYLYNMVSVDEPGNATIQIGDNANLFINESAVVLMDDTVSRVVLFGGSTAGSRRSYVPTSVFPAQSGNFSYGFNLTIGSTVQLICTASVKPSCFNTSRYEYVEFWINVGTGGQSFSLAFNNAQVRNYVPGYLPKNTWVKQRVHLLSLYHSMIVKSGQPIEFFNTMTFTSVGTALVQNMIYIDNVRMIPYEEIETDKNRKLFVYDYCGLKSALVFPYEYKPLDVSVRTVPVSCNVNSTISTELAQDGGLVAEVINGVGPFTYSWVGYGGATTQNLSGFSYMTSYISVYDNALNTSWADVSVAREYNLNDTTYYLSAPSSISYTPLLDGDGLIFQTFPEIETSQFPILEFWAHGGPLGGQTFSVSITRAIAPTANTAFLNPATNVGYTTLPANQWTKIQLNLPIVALSANRVSVVIFANLYVLNAGNNNYSVSQNTIYFDDVRFIGKNVLTVTDSTGCKASTPVARVTTPPILTQKIHVTNAKCFNNTNGVVAVSMNGGVPPYHYQWSTTDEDGATASGIPESYVYLNLSDSNSCKFVPVNTTVLQPPPIEIDLTIQHPQCHGDTGAALASALGGSGSYTYSWVSNSGVARTFTRPAPEAIFLDDVVAPFELYNADQLCDGSGTHLQDKYPVHASHSGYCTLSLFSSSEAVSKVIGCSSCMSPAKYDKVVFWAYTENATALQLTSISLSNSTSYSVKIPLSELASVDIIAGKWIRFEAKMNVFTGVVNPDGFAFFKAPGSIKDTILIDDFVVVSQALASGFGTAPGYVSEVEVRAGLYYLTIVDGNGCSSTHNVLVEEPKVVNITYNSTSPTKSNGADGSVSLSAEGGFPPYTYVWMHDNSTRSSAENLAYGAYIVQVTDSKSCSKEFTVYVSPYIPPNAIKILGYNSQLSSGLAALVGIGFLVSFFSGAMLYRYWAAFSILGSFLSSMVLVGCVLSFLAALVLLPEPTDALCTSFIWFLGVGFVLVYGCLFIKTWALYQVWRNAVRYQKAHLTPLYIIKCLCLAVTIEIIFLAVWTAIDPPTVKLVKSVDNQGEYQCDTNHITFWIIFLVTKGAWLIFGAVLSVLTRNIAKEYNESTSIAYAIYNNVLLGAIAIPLAILLKQVPGGRLTVEVVIICIAYCFTMVVIFFRIWHSIMLPNKIPMNNSEMRKRPSNSSGSYKSGTTMDRDSRGSPNQSSISKAEVSASEAAV